MRHTERNDRWHKAMYDRWFASTTIGSKRFRSLAKKEADFLVSKLGLLAGARVLDIPCGTGRHSLIFAQHGLEVTGIDISNDCLRLARVSCKNTKITFRNGNMAQLSRYREKYDAVFNLFSSFGYFSTDAKNEQVLSELISTLKSGGKIGIHLISRDWLMKVFRPVDWRNEGGKFILEARRYDPKTHYNEAQMVVVEQRTSKAKIYHHRMRLYSKPEMVAMMKRCGLKKIQVYGNFDGGAYKKSESTHPIYIGEKP